VVEAVPSWRPGYYVWPTGGTKLLLLGGIGTKTGDSEHSFAGMLRYLAEHGGYDLRRDVLEGTYAGREVNGNWEPLPYTSADTRRPLIDTAEAVAGCLEWYRQRLPDGVRLAILGYSLGGVVGLDGATLAVARDRQTWQGRVGAVVTFAAPMRGCSVGALINWAWLITAEPEALGDAGRDLDARWKDAQEQTRLERRAAFLRRHGAQVLTLVDPDDSVVRPEEGLILAPGETLSDLQIQTQVRRPGSLGHGAILDEPAVWRRVLRTIGPQRRAADEQIVDPIEDELQALKARMRREGRLK
jgi:thioesterase domain-containing protein